MKKIEKNTLSHRRWIQKRIAVGGCVSCARKAVAGKRRCLTCLKERRAYEADRRRDPAFKKQMSQRLKKWRYALKCKVIRGYGGKCVCCGEREIDFLNLDHKRKQGAQHRREEGHKAIGPALYKKLIALGFPRTMFQVKCWNCNCTEGIFGSCPHKRKRQNV